MIFKLSEILSSPPLEINPVPGTFPESGSQERRSCGWRVMAVFMHLLSSPHTLSCSVLAQRHPASCKHGCPAHLQVGLLCHRSRCVSAWEPCLPLFLHKMLQTRTKTCAVQKTLLVFGAHVLGSTPWERLPGALLLLFALLYYFPYDPRPISSAFVSVMHMLELVD